MLKRPGVMPQSSRDNYLLRYLAAVAPQKTSYSKKEDYLKGSREPKVLAHSQVLAHCALRLRSVQAPMYSAEGQIVALRATCLRIVYSKGASPSNLSVLRCRLVRKNLRVLAPVGSFTFGSKNWRIYRGAARLRIRDLLMEAINATIQRLNGRYHITGYWASIRRPNNKASDRAPAYI